jgi:hypothetical protein
MSDPQRLDSDKPRRAEPLQPDKPGSGRRARPGDAQKHSTSDTLPKAEEQEKAAVDNAREGYG